MQPCLDVAALDLRHVTNQPTHASGPTSCSSSSSAWSRSHSPERASDRRWCLRDLRQLGLTHYRCRPNDNCTTKACVPRCLDRCARLAQFAVHVPRTLDPKGSPTTGCTGREAGALTPKPLLCTLFLDSAKKIGSSCNRTVIESLYAVGTTTTRAKFRRGGGQKRWAHGLADLSANSFHRSSLAASRVEGASVRMCRHVASRMRRAKGESGSDEDKKQRFYFFS